MWWQERCILRGATLWQPRTPLPCVKDPPVFFRLPMDQHCLYADSSRNSSASCAIAVKSTKHADIVKPQCTVCWHSKKQPNIEQTNAFAKISANAFKNIRIVFRYFHLWLSMDDGVWSADNFKNLQIILCRIWNPLNPPRSAILDLPYISIRP